MIKYVISLLTLFSTLNLDAQDLYKVLDGKVKFISDAPLELIQAQTTSVTGLLNITDRSFAFIIPMSTFEGFNSKLQKTHFNENYIQTAKYPNATFEGKIIEEIDFSKLGKYEVRGKGKFQVHGVEQVRIVKCTITTSKSKVAVSSNFSVLLADHNIKIPSVVAQKITEEVVVEVNINMAPK